MVDPTVSAAATATLETAINKALQYDPATRLRLQALAGKSLAIDVQELKLQLCFHFNAQDIRISREYDNPTTRLSGSLPGLILLATGERINLADSGVEAWGNTALLAEIKAIASDVELDWEDAINEWVGDIAGHQLATKLRLQLGWVQQRASTGKRLLSEFFTEELRAIPSNIELQQFSDHVDTLRLAADRVSARVARLQHSLASQKPQA